MTDSDYFALFGFDEQFALDEKTLETRYLSRSRSVHPDRFVSAPSNERVMALQQSMLLNDAYNTLKDPLRRAEYLLMRNGVGIGDNERLDPAFLMDVLESREHLAEAKRVRDIGTLRRLEEDMLDRRDAAFARLASLFSELVPTSTADDSAGSDRETRLEQIKQQVILLRYVRRYLDEFDDVFDDEDEP